MLAECVGECASGLDALQQIREQTTRRRALGPVGEQAEGLVNREARIQQGSQLAGHDSDLAAGYPATAAKHWLVEHSLQRRASGGAERVRSERQVALAAQ